MECTSKCFKKERMNFMLRGENCDFWLSNHKPNAYSVDMIIYTDKDAGLRIESCAKLKKFSKNL